MIKYILPLALLASSALAQAPRVGGLDVRNNLGEIAAADAGAASATNVSMNGMFVQCASAAAAGHVLQVHATATAE